MKSNYEDTSKQNYRIPQGIFYIAISEQKIAGEGLDQKVLEELGKKVTKTKSATWDQTGEWHDSGSYSDVSWQNSVP